MKISTPWIVFLISVSVGTLVWIASPAITGRREPWDVPGFYYWGTLFFAGSIAGLLAPSRFWLWAVAIWIGQCIGFLGSLAIAGEVGSLAPLGFILLGVFSVLSLIGAAVGAAAAALLRR